jgi:hypothetical protein
MFLYVILVAPRHSAHLAYLRSTAGGYSNSHVVGDHRPNAAAPAQPVAGDFSHRSQRRLPAASGSLQVAAHQRLARRPLRVQRTLAHRRRLHGVGDTVCT